MDSSYSKKQICIVFILAFIQSQVLTYACTEDEPCVRLKQLVGNRYEISLTLPVPRNAPEFEKTATLHLTSQLHVYSQEMTLTEQDSSVNLMYAGIFSIPDQYTDLKIDYSFLRQTVPNYYSFSYDLADLMKAGSNGLKISCLPLTATYEDLLEEAKGRKIPGSDLPGYVAYRMHMNSEMLHGNWNKKIPGLPHAATASCTNVDFEDGNLNGWTGTTGMNPGCCLTPGFIAGRQTITSGGGLDACGGFPVVCPGGSYSLQLGANVSGGLAEQLIQTFTVSAASTNFTYKYAVVLEDPGHSLAQQPFFKVEMIDQNGNPIPCSYYFVAAGQNIPGFMNSATCPGVVYKPWSTVSVDLSAYVGQQVTIRFTAADCTLGGHFGYAYVDGTCLPLALSSSGDVCTGNTVTLTAPAGSQSYLWSPGGQTTQSITVNKGGTYSCTLTSVQGCNIVLSIPVKIYPAPLVQFSSASGPCSSAFNFTNNSSCPGDTISSVVWNFGNAGSADSSQNPSHTYPAPGNYTVSLQVSTIHGCSNSASQVVVALARPVLLLKPTDVSCFGGSNGTAVASVTGGQLPLTFVWSNGANTTLNPGLDTGTYTCTVTDAKGCQVVDSVHINGPSRPLSIATTQVPATCFNVADGSSSALVSGGTPGYTYVWNTNPVQTTSLVQHLSSGTYSVTVTDKNGCVASVPIVISQPQAINVSSTIQNVSCFGGRDGSLAVSASGGTGPYNYTWNTTPVQSAAVLLNLTAGAYSLTLSDANGCVAQLNETVTEPSAVNATIISSIDPVCFGDLNGRINSGSSGGTPPYQYSWNTVPMQQTPSAMNLGAGNYLLTVTDAKGCISTIAAALKQPLALTTQATAENLNCYGDKNGWISSTVSGGTLPYSYLWNTGASQTSTITGLSAGSYVLTVTDSRGCTSSATTLITQPMQLLANINTSDETCNGGNNGWLSSSVSGGTTPYSYSWNTAIPASNATIIGLKAGSYMLTVTDNKGCAVSLSATIHEPTPILLSAYGSMTICAGQSASLYALATGGNGSYNYKWNQGIGAGASQVVTPKTSTSYVVTVTDNAGCKGPSDTVNIQVTVMDSSNLVMSPARNLCPGQSTEISASVNGNTGTVTYSWSNNLGTSPGPFSVSPTTTTTYTVYVLNSCGVRVSGSVSVHVNPFPLISIVPQNAAGCGTISLAFANNATNPGASFLWDFGDGNTSQLASPEHVYLQTGIYTVTLNVVSAAGCLKSGAVTDSVIVYAPTIASFVSPDQVSELAPVIQFTNTSVNDISWSWDFGDHTGSNAVNPIHTYKEKGTYLVTLRTVSPNGCLDSVSKPIEVIPEFSFYVPNAFTPDADGRNDIFNGKGEEIKDFKMTIFDRWGEMIYSTTDKEKGWDGRANNGTEIAQIGVYVYMISLHDFSGKQHDYEGKVTLLK